MELFPPTGLEYVAGSAKGHVERITLLDLRYEEELKDVDKLLDFISREIDIVCVSVGWNRQLDEIYDLLNRMPDKIPLVAGGYTATEITEELFTACPKIDIIVRGEGEETIKEIFDDVPLKSILGISYRKNGRVIHNANRPLPDVNTVAAPDRSLRRNTYNMRLNGVNIARPTYDYVLSARGCVYNCKFCTFSLNPLGQKRTYAARSIQSVVDEIEEMTADLILFSDDNFFVDVKRAEEFCDLIIERKIKKRFIAQTRIEIARYPALLEKAVKVGFKMFLIGIESPHDRILAQMNKGFDSNNVREYFKVLKNFPIHYHGYFIYGNIGETEEEMLCIAKFAKEIGVDTIAYNKLRVDKYSPLRQLAENTPGYHVTDKGELYSDTYSHSALKKIGKKIRFAFYTPLCFLKMGKKLARVKLYTFKEAMLLLAACPFIFRNIIAKEIREGRLGRSLRSIFIKNS
ncbi:B12-binding domain-containing radical SAM protein [Candidatus Omnitrophota bacterium]